MTGSCSICRREREVEACANCGEPVCGDCSNAGFCELCESEELLYDP